MVKDLAVICAAVIVNFIIYYSFGTVVLFKRHEKTPVSLRLVVGFFAYYAVFFFFCVPVMKFYRPLSMLSAIWVTVVIIFAAAAALLLLYSRAGSRGDPRRQKLWAESAEPAKEGDCAGKPDPGSKPGPFIIAGFILLVLVQIILVAGTYNFTLDASYYVAGVSTNVDTDMINVYDPFTGAWQDHFEMRYFFATYSVQDAVVCRLTGIEPLIWTKSVMATVIIILTNLVYFMTAKELVRVGFISSGREGSQSDPSVQELKEDPARFAGDGKLRDKEVKPELLVLLMMGLMFFINITFNTIYTSSLFLMTRTYEGKAIVGNLAIMTVFYLFIRMNNAVSVEGSQGALPRENTGEGNPVRPWLSVFLVCFGASTISSTANMLMPVELTVLFLPLIIRAGRFKWIPKYVLCVVPGMAFALAFVLYVKGYFVFYTYPR